MRIIHLIPLLGVLFLTGCATADLSILDNAVPLKAKQLQITEYQSLGIDAFTLAGQVPDTLGFGAISKINQPYIGCLSGIQVGLGLGKDMEIDTKLSGGHEPIGEAFLIAYQISMKYRLYHPEQNVSIAVMPGLKFQKCTGVELPEPQLLGHADMYYDASIHTIEMPIIISWKTKSKYPFNPLPGKYPFLHSIITRVSYDRIAIDYWHYVNPDNEIRRQKDVNTWRVGLLYNLALPNWLSISTLSVTCGVEISPLNYSNVNLIPVIAVGMRFPQRYDY